MTGRCVRRLRIRSRIPGAVPADTRELKRRLAEAEAAAAENLKRAELAEYRQQAHQERWALEIDRLRQELRAMRGGR